MQSFTIAMAVVFLAATSSALTPVKARIPSSCGATISVVFQGANPPVAQYTENITTGADFIDPANSLSISTVVVPSGYTCEFKGVDRLDVTVTGNGAAQALGPPQTVIGVRCW